MGRCRSGLRTEVLPKSMYCPWNSEVERDLNRSIYDLFLKWHHQYSLFVEYQSIDLFKALFNIYAIRSIGRLQCCNCYYILQKWCLSWYSFILILNLHFVFCYLVNGMKLFFKSSNRPRMIEPNWPTENWLRDEVSIKTESRLLVFIYS